MAEPKILVGILTYAGQQYCRKQFIQFLCSLSYPNLDFLFVTNSGEEDKQDIETAVTPLRELGRNVTTLIDDREVEQKFDVVINGRNLIRDEFLKSDAEHLFFLDSDVLGPKNLIEALLRHKKEMVSGFYLGFFANEGGKREPRPVAWKAVNETESRQLHLVELSRPRLIKLSIAGMGCVLIQRKLMKQFPFRRLKDDIIEGGEDTAFFLDAKAAGYQLWGDTLVQCMHMKYKPGHPLNKMLDPRNYKIRLRKAQ